jgi:hypothetical protein
VPSPHYRYWVNFDSFSDHFLLVRDAEESLKDYPILNRIVVTLPLALTSMMRYQSRTSKEPHHFGEVFKLAGYPAILSIGRISGSPIQYATG